MKDSFYTLFRTSPPYLLYLSSPSPSPLLLSSIKNLDNTILSTSSALSHQSRVLPWISFFITFILHLIRLPFVLFCKDHLNINPSYLLIINSVLEIPWALKIITALFIDKIKFQKRFFILISGLMIFFSLFFLRNEKITFFCAFIFSSGLSLIDVVNDGLILQMSRNYSRISIDCFLYRSIGVFAGQVFNFIFLRFVDLNYFFVFVSFFALSFFILGLRVKDRISNKFLMDEDFEFSYDQESGEIIKEVSYKKENPPAAITDITEDNFALVKIPPITDKSRPPQALTNQSSHPTNKLSPTSPDEKFKENSKSTTSPTSTLSILKKLRIVLSTPDLRNLLIFTSIVNAFPSAGMAIFYFLSSRQGLGFSRPFLSLLVIFGGLAHIAGNLIYKRFFMGTSIRRFYRNILFLKLLVYLSELVLVLRLNRALHISDKLFAVGEDVVGDALFSMMVLPVNLMLGSRGVYCEEMDGIEGTVSSAIGSIGNVAGIGSRVLSSGLIWAFGIGVDSFDRLGWVIVTVVGIKCSGFLLLRFLPDRSIYSDGADE